MNAPNEGDKPLQVRVVPRSDHQISRRFIDSDALKVMYRLHRNHHLAYLVGGGVRDILLGVKPKDFDVGTDATPSRIRRLFRNSRIIGRRFPIVHIYFQGGKLVEVSTFRRNTANGNDMDPKMRDDTWGDPSEDAWRRDLTINGLFYDISSFSVIDYVGGLEDLDSRVIRTIGDPYVRFREDPVRMIRAIRHAARTRFRVDQRTFDAICELCGLIRNCAPARVLEEFLRELRGGAAIRSLRMLRETGLLRLLAPGVDDYLSVVEAEDTDEVEQFWTRFEALDRVCREEEIPSNAVTLSLLLAMPVLKAIREVEGGSPRGGKPDIGRVVRDTLLPMLADLGASRRDTERCFHILLAGRRIRRALRDGRIPPGLQAKSYFPETWAYFRVVLESEGWAQERIAGMVRKPAGSRSRRSRRRRRRAKRRKAD